jgi:putative hydrolase of the HAD superfamily
MPIMQLFFDLDDTLYPAGNGIWNEISSRITSFMMDRLGLSIKEAEERRQRYYKEFGTSLTGLMVDYDVDPADYLAFVHDIPLHNYLSPEPRLISMLQALPQTKAVFTNASRAHAANVLRLLAIESHFELIIAIEDTNFANKPDLRAYTLALTLANQPSGNNSLLIDDRLDNLKPAADLGMTTVLVSQQHRTADFLDHQIPSILDLTQAVPGLKKPQSQFNERA